jgi:hypothetical protein
MDPKDPITITNLNDLCQQLDNSVKDTISLSGYESYPNTIVGGGFSHNSYGAVPNITISSPNVTTTTFNGPYTINSGAGATGINSPWYSQPTSPKIRLDGEGADIEVNGRSLMDMIERIEQRLNILTPNTELEAEWAELKTLGEQYRKLEKHIKDKQATWDRLKATQPKID